MKNLVKFIRMFAGRYLIYTTLCGIIMAFIPIMNDGSSMIEAIGIKFLMLACAIPVFVVTLGDYFRESKKES